MQAVSQNLTTWLNRMSHIYTFNQQLAKLLHKLCVLLPLSLHGRGGPAPLTSAKAETSGP